MHTMGSATASSPGVPIAAWRSAIAGNHLPGLDGLRAVAVFMVVFGHAGLRSAAPDVGVLAFSFSAVFSSPGCC